MATVDNYESLLPTLPATQLDVEAGPPAHPSPIADIVAGLRTITPLDGLTEEEYTWLATKGTERVGGDRSIVFRENEPACNMNFILRGEVQVRRRNSNAPLFALGKLAANLSHELNNPASAAQRSAASLFGELREYGEQKYRLGNMCLPDETTGKYRDWIKNARARMSAYSNLPKGSQNPLANADREEMLVKWLTEHNVANPWTIAPALSETTLAFDLLDELAEIVGPEVLPIAVATVASSLRVERMAETVVDSTVRIFDLISAIKDYSYMDQAPIQDVDLAQSLENTLVMFNSRLRNVKVELEFDQNLETVSAYGSELNQVWTALIENALDAMNDRGTLRLLTKGGGQMALVEVWDSGPGIDPVIKSRLFEPFFTTKAPGRGLGLGLDTVQRIVNKHSGFVTVESKPGATCFQVRLPLDRLQAY
jgi:signal transduction histidine kinase